jgi:aquaporin Z
MEAGEMSLYMFSICSFATLLQHPASPVRHFFISGIVRRALMGLAIGATVIALIISPWGKQSGGHINPAMTFAFYRLGKIRPWDALFYGVAQFSGATSGVALATFLLRGAPGDVTVRYAVTAPGVYGAAVAFAAELAISFILMITVLLVTNHERFARYTPYFVGSLYAVNITFETPLSGMSMNPRANLWPLRLRRLLAHSLDLFHRTDSRHVGRSGSFSSRSPRRASVLRQTRPCQQQTLHIPS